MNLCLGRHVRSSGIRILCAFVLAAFFHAADASTLPTALEPTSGGGQFGLVNQTFPFTISARVTDTGGMPVAGVPVHFEVNQCVSIGAPICPPPSAYPYFSGNNNAVVITSDEDGRASAPPLIAGDQAGNYQVFATIHPPGTITHAYYSLRQIASSSAVPITAGFTGAWYDPNQSGQGLFVEVLTENRLLAYWFTFTPDGTQQAWFGGVGSIIANQAVIYADQGQGGRWIPGFDPTAYSRRLWGTLAFTFTDCNHGRVDFTGNGIDSPWGENQMDLTRLTQPAGLSCP